MGILVETWRASNEELLKEIDISLVGMIGAYTAWGRHHLGEITLRTPAGIVPERVPERGRRYIAIADFIRALRRDRIAPWREEIRAIAPFGARTKRIRLLDLKDREVSILGDLTALLTREFPEFTRFNRRLTDLREEISRRAEEVRKITIDFIGTDADTGFNIFYYTPETYYFNEDERGFEVTRSAMLEIDYTFSLETGTSHGKPLPFVAEITGKIFVRAKDREAMNSVEEAIQETLRRYVRDAFDTPKIAKATAEGRVAEPFALLSEKVIKEAVEYKFGEGDETHVDFTFEKTKPEKWKETKRLRLVE